MQIEPQFPPKDEQALSTSSVSGKDKHGHACATDAHKNAKMHCPSNRVDRQLLRFCAYTHKRVSLIATTHTQPTFSVTYTYAANM